MGNRPEEKQEESLEPIANVSGEYAAIIQSDQSNFQKLHAIAESALSNDEATPACKRFLSRIQEMTAPGKRCNEKAIRGAFARFWQSVPLAKKSLFVGPQPEAGAKAMIVMASVLAGQTCEDDNGEWYHILMPTLVHRKHAGVSAITDYALADLIITGDGKRLLHNCEVLGAAQKQRSVTPKIEFVEDDQSKAPLALGSFEWEQLEKICPQQVPEAYTNAQSAVGAINDLSPQTIALLYNLYEGVKTRDNSGPDSSAIDREALRSERYQKAYAALSKCPEEEQRALKALGFWAIIHDVTYGGECMSLGAGSLIRLLQQHDCKLPPWPQRVYAWFGRQAASLGMSLKLLLTGGMQIIPINISPNSENPRLATAATAAGAYNWRDFFGLRFSDGRPFGRWDSLIRCLYLAPLFHLIRNLLTMVFLGPINELRAVLTPSLLFLRAFENVMRTLRGGRGYGFFYRHNIIGKMLCVFCFFLLGVLALIPIALHLLTMLLLPIFSPSAALQGVQHYLQRSSDEPWFGDEESANLAREQKIIWACKAYIALTSLLLFVFAAPLLYGLLGAILPHGAMVSFISLCQHMTSLPVLHQLGVGVAYVVQPILNFFGLSAIPLPVVRAVMSIVALLLVSSLLEYAHQRLSPRVSLFRKNEVDVRGMMHVQQESQCAKNLRWLAGPHQMMSSVSVLLRLQRVHSRMGMTALAMD